MARLVAVCSRLPRFLRGLRSPLTDSGQDDGTRAAIGQSELASVPGRVRLPRASLVRARLPGANLSQADLGAADLRRANLVEADLQGAILRNTNLDGANLRGADLRTAYLVCATLRRADLRGADLCGANLRWTNLRGADLRGVHRIDPRWPGSSLRYVLRTRSLVSDLRGAWLSPHGSFALALILHGVDLSSTVWSGPVCAATVAQFLGPLLAALTGQLANGPPVEELLELGFNHWSSEGGSVLTSVDSIGNTPLKIMMMRTLLEYLAERPESQLGPVAWPLLDVLTRNPCYQDILPGLAERLARLGRKSGIPRPPVVPRPPTIATVRA